MKKAVKASATGRKTVLCRRNNRISLLEIPWIQVLESLKDISQAVPSPVLVRLLTASPASISRYQRALLVCGCSCFWSLDPQWQVQVCFPKSSRWCSPAWKGGWRNAESTLCLLWAQPTALFLCRRFVLTANHSHTCFHFYPPPCCYITS